MTELHFQHDDWGQLLLTLPDRSEPIVVEPVRCFPLTHPDEHISLVDSEGQEVLRIARVAELPADSRSALEHELAEREFSPVIRRILQAGPAVPCAWLVETDRGVTSFEIDSDDDFRKLPNGSVIITDANGIRFRIPDSEALDAGSRVILRRFL